MNINEVLDKLFPSGHSVEVKEHIVYGEAQTASGKISVIGTNETYIGIEEILKLGDCFSEVMKKHPGRPILMLVDNNGQRMALKEELLGLSQYIANLVKFQDCARRAGHKLISLVYGNSIAGGFIAFGLCAGRTYALKGANTSVMNLPAIARVTKLKLEYLEELSKSVPVFAPGCENFHKMGGIQEIWEDNLPACLEKALAEDDSEDNRTELGMKRGGRVMAKKIIESIINAE